MLFYKKIIIGLFLFYLLFGYNKSFYYILLSLYFFLFFVYFKKFSYIFNSIYYLLIISIYKNNFSSLLTKTLCSKY